MRAHYQKAIENRVNESVGWSEPAPVPSGGVGETTADSAADIEGGQVGNLLTRLRPRALVPVRAWLLRRPRTQTNGAHDLKRIK